MAFFPLASFAADTAPKVFQPEISIPGLQNLPDDSSLMARYIRAVYIFFVWIVGLLAVVMIIYGGIRWVAAAGNAGHIKEARDIVTNAIAGVVLALLSVVILRTINPDLTEIKTLSPGSVKGKDIRYAEVKNPDGTCKLSSLIPCGLSCTDTRGTVYGKCIYCISAQVEDKSNSCGDFSGDPAQVSSEANCVYAKCPKSNQVCEKVQTNLTQGHLCSSEARLPSFSIYGYDPLGISYSDKYSCGEIWWEKAGLFALDPEEINVGQKCPNTQYCIVDYAQNITLDKKRSDIPSTESAYKIGFFKDSGCH